MLLTSSIEPTGPKSNKHYVVLHHNDQHDLLHLPKTYSDLETQVQRLYHVRRGQFHIETNDLNLCKGIRIRIPEDSWTDVCILLGNVYIVPSLYESPESAPPAVERSLDTQSVAASKDRKPSVDSNTLYRKIIPCEPNDEQYISETLATIRREGSISGTTWHGQQSNPKSWADPRWNMSPKTVFVLRIVYPANPIPEISTIFLGTRGEPTSQSVRILINGERRVVDEFNAKGEEVRRGVVNLSPTPSPGEQTITFVNHQGSLYVIFDYRRSINFPNTVINSWKPVEVFLHVATDRVIHLDVYELGN